MKFVFPTQKEIRQDINRRIAGANGYIKSDVPCLCGRNHYMIYAGRRDPNSYNIVHKITTLPHCPIRVWTYADQTGMGMGLRTLLESLKVQE